MKDELKEAFGQVLPLPLSRQTQEEICADFAQVPKEITAAIASADRSWRDRKTTLYFDCEGCKTKLSVPRGKGKVRIVCPNCGQEMFKET